MAPRAGAGCGKAVGSEARWSAVAERRAFFSCLRRGLLHWINSLNMVEKAGLPLALWAGLEGGRFGLNVLRLGEVLFATKCISTEVLPSDNDLFHG